MKSVLWKSVAAVPPSISNQVNHLHELITINAVFLYYMLFHLPPSLPASCFASPFFPILRPILTPTWNLNFSTIALICLPASTLFRIHCSLHSITELFPKTPFFIMLVPWVITSNGFLLSRLFSLVFQSSPPSGSTAQSPPLPPGEQSPPSIP